MTCNVSVRAGCSNPRIRNDHTVSRSKYEARKGQQHVILRMWAEWRRVVGGVISVPFDVVEKRKQEFSRNCIVSGAGFSEIAVGSLQWWLLIPINLLESLDKLKLQFDWARWRSEELSPFSLQRTTIWVSPTHFPAVTFYTAFSRSPLAALSDTATEATSRQ